MFNRPVIEIELTPVSLRVSVMGRADATVHTPLDRSAWENTWSSGLRMIDEPLRAALRRLGVGPKARAVVTYPGPDAIAELIRVRGTSTEAVAAARLAARESSSDASGPLAVRIVDSFESAGHQHSHVFAVGDTSFAAEIVADWVRRAGLRVDGISSIRAAVLGEAIRNAQTITTGDHVLVQFDEHATAIVGISSGRVAFARGLGFGFDLLIEAIARGARDFTRDGQTTISREELREILFRTGTPARGDVLHEKLGLRGEHVLPLLHPVLQRFAVEIRQTLRFAKIEGSGEAQQVTLAGPGAAIRNIDNVFGEFVDVSVGYLHADGSARDSASGAVQLRYTPDSEMHERGRILIRRGTQFGACASACVLGLFAFAAGNEIRTQTMRLEQLRPELQRVETIRTQRHELSELINNVRLDEQAIERAVGERVCWAAGLAEVSRLMPSGVTLHEITGSIEARAQDREGGPLFAMKGSAPLSADAQAPNPADAFAESLRGSRVLTAAEFTSSRILQSDEGSTRQFILAAKPLSLPARLTARTDRAATKSLTAVDSTSQTIAPTTGDK